MARRRCSVEPSSARSGIAEQAADEEPHREAGHDAWEQLLHLAHVEQPARLPADEHEPELERDREEDEEDRRHPDAARQRGSARTRRTALRAHRGVAVAIRTSRVRRAARAMSADAPLPNTAIAMYVAGSHSEPYASRNSAFAGMMRSASVTPNANACAVSRPTTPRVDVLLTALGRPDRRSRAVG